MEETVEKEDKKGGVNLEEMMEAGLHFGHKTSRTHPKMKPYITGVRNTVHIINLEKTKEKLEDALDALKEMVASGKNVVLVGTKVQTRALVREVAEECGVPYVTERWIGGLLTNFEEVSKRIAYLKELEEKLANKEEASKYTKWERHEMAEEIKKLEQKFGGVRHLEKLPYAMVLFDLDGNQLAVREAKHKGVVIFAITDTNSDPTSVEYAIPANDDAVSSLKYIATKVKEAILEGKKQAPLRAEQEDNGDNRPS
jgi:small subunit ribosomal protein S2